MLIKLLTKVFGSRNDRTLRRMRKVVNIINAMEPEMEKLSDEELKGKTAEFRARLEKGEVLENLIPEAFAVVREASKRVFGMRHFDVQLLGGMVLNERCIAEMRTGEGKTLTATLPAYLNALTGKGVHVVTVNDYLAQRDAENNRPLFEFLGLTVGINLPGMPAPAKREAYAADITYGTNNEYGFDYLRDNMAFSPEERVQRKLHYALVDEVDSILIDEARTPLIISGPAEDSSEMYKRVNKIIPHLIRQEKEYYRNAFLCNAMVNMYMIDTNSMGIPMIYEIQKGKCFPLPTFDLDTPNRVVVTVYGKVLDPNYTRLLHANDDLDLRTVFLLDQVQKKKTISKEDFSQLKSRNLVEGRYPNIFVSYKVAKGVGDKANYVRQKGLDEEVCMHFILSTLKLGPAKKSDLLAVLKDVLPDVLTDQQKSRKLSNLLQKMKKNGIIDVRGIAINSEWYLLTKD